MSSKNTVCKLQILWPDPGQSTSKSAENPNCQSATLASFGCSAVNYVCNLVVIDFQNCNHICDSPILMIDENSISILPTRILLTSMVLRKIHKHPGL